MLGEEVWGAVNITVHPKGPSTQTSFMEELHMGVMGSCSQTHSYVVYLKSTQ